jgi:hypothetical protein
MNAAPIVLLLGGSLLTDSIAHGLADRLMMNVIRMEPALLEIKDCLQCLHPDLVVLNLGDPYSDHLVSLLNERQELKLAGLDVADCHLILLTGHQYVSSTILNLLSAMPKGPKKQASSTNGGG